MIWDNLNPDFHTSFVQDFIFEKKQVYKIEARDLDNKEGTKWDSLGQAQFEMGQLIGATGSSLILPLKLADTTQKKMGDLIIRAETVSSQNDILHLIWGCKELNGFGLCSTPKPFIE